MKHSIEIGSEFEARETKENNFEIDRYFDDWQLTYSGRTSIQVVLEDICAKEKVVNAWLPSYCCSSMLQPFLAKNLHLKFYHVYVNESGNLDIEHFAPERNDVVLVMEYFGFQAIDLKERIIQWQDRQSIVIEDCTHSLLQRKLDFIANYQVASLRKWFPLACGGAARKREGNLLCNWTQPDERLIATRIEAMREKALYLAEEASEESKDSFLEKYRIFNEALSSHYENCEIDDWSNKILTRQNVKKVIEIRRNNAKVLLEGIQSFKRITPLFKQCGERDCPLFVPILVEEREKLRQILTKNKIYCPIHWPIPVKEAKSNLYQLELSLICDQRYGTEHMERIVGVLEQFEKER